MPRYEPVEVSLPDLLVRAERDRLELQAADLRIGIAERAVYLARQGRLPSMALTGTYEWTQETSTLQPANTSWTVVLAASLPIFDGGRTKAQVAQARSDVEDAKTGREQILQGVALQVRQAYLSLREAQVRLQATANAVEAAREAARLARVRYEAGVGTTVEVTDAVAALTGANTNYVTAAYDARVSLAQLESAIGGPIEGAEEGSAS